MCDFIVHMVAESQTHTSHTVTANKQEVQEFCLYESRFHDVITIKYQNAKPVCMAGRFNM